MLTSEANKLKGDPCREAAIVQQQRDLHLPIWIIIDHLLVSAAKKREFYDQLHRWSSQE